MENSRNLTLEEVEEESRKQNEKFKFKKGDYALLSQGRSSASRKYAGNVYRIKFVYPKILTLDIDGINKDVWANEANPLSKLDFFRRTIKI